MNRSLRLTLLFLMALGFALGFAGLVVPNQTALLETPRAGTYQFQRLHIFLFNLVSGGAILLWFTEGHKKLSRRAVAYLVLALLFSLSAFLNQYAPAIFLALVMAAIVESIRIQHFSFFPFDFFTLKASVAEKFHHAALLCLSLGLLISAGVMLNNQYLHLFDFLNLLLDDFFLGFSFPLSLMTFAVMFALMKEPDNRRIRLWREASFWIVTLGVIIFFVFIILGIFAAELLLSCILLGDVLLIFYLFRRDSEDLEQDEFLTSGMAFLTFTGVTGILILLWSKYVPQNQASGWDLLFQIHAYLSLYGWNLSGLSVVIRHDKFPLRLHDAEIILLHWVTIALLAPLGSLYPAFAVLALPAFVLLLALIFFGRGQAHVAARKRSLALISTPFWRKNGTTEV
jgi:hypothetical protein